MDDKGTLCMCDYVGVSFFLHTRAESSSSFFSFFFLRSTQRNIEEKRKKREIEMPHRAIEVPQQSYELLASER